MGITLNEEQYERTLNEVDFKSDQNKDNDIAAREVAKSLIKGMKGSLDNGKISQEEFDIYVAEVVTLMKKQEMELGSLTEEMNKKQKEILKESARKIKDGGNDSLLMNGLKTGLYYPFGIETDLDKNNPMQNFIKGIMDELLALPEVLLLLLPPNSKLPEFIEGMKNISWEQIKQTFFEGVTDLGSGDAYKVGRSSVFTILLATGLGGLLKSGGSLATKVAGATMLKTGNIISKTGRVISKPGEIMLKPVDLIYDGTKKLTSKITKKGDPVIEGSAVGAAGESTGISSAIDTGETIAKETPEITRARQVLETAELEGKGVKTAKKELDDLLAGQKTSEKLLEGLNGLKIGDEVKYVNVKSTGSVELNGKIESFIEEGGVVKGITFKPTSGNRFTINAENIGRFSKLENGVYKPVVIDSAELARLKKVEEMAKLEGHGEKTATKAVKDAKTEPQKSQVEPPKTQVETPPPSTHVKSKILLGGGTIVAGTIERAVRNEAEADFIANGGELPGNHDNPSDDPKPGDNDEEIIEPDEQAPEVIPETETTKYVSLQDPNSRLNVRGSDGGIIGKLSNLEEVTVIGNEEITLNNRVGYVKIKYQVDGKDVEAYVASEYLKNEKPGEGDKPDSSEKERELQQKLDDANKEKEEAIKKAQEEEQKRRDAEEKFKKQEEQAKIDAENAKLETEIKLFHSQTKELADKGQKVEVGTWNSETKSIKAGEGDSVEKIEFYENNFEIYKNPEKQGGYILEMNGTGVFEDDKVNLDSFPTKNELNKKIKEMFDKHEKEDEGKGFKRKFDNKFK